MSRPTKNKGFDDAPLWNHVEVVSASGGGGNRTWKCKYCGKRVVGSYSKVKGHLLRLPGQGVEHCKKMSDDLYAEIKKEYYEAEEKKAKFQQNTQQSRAYVSLPEGSDITQHKKRKGTIQYSFNVLEREEADKECAMMFYTGGISFNFARNPYFRAFCQRLANGNLHGYGPPTYERLRTTLLAQLKAHVEQRLQPTRDSWKKKGASICSDGWSDQQSRPLINIMVGSSSGPMFMKAIDASEALTKDAEYIANIFFDVIENIGDDRVVQVVTDNGANFKAAGALIEERYPHIFWTPCVVHCLNLVLKAICDPSEKSAHYLECKWVKELVSQVNEINNFVTNHGLSKAIFNRYSDIKLLKVAETRFASHIVMASRVRRLKEALEKMVMDADWKNFRVNGKTPTELKARDIKDLLVSDGWWDKVDYFLSFTEPMVKFLRIGDMDSCVLPYIYDMWDSTVEEVKRRIFDHEDQDLKEGYSTFFNAIHEILEARWNKSNTPLHCMAHSLLPKYYSENWLQGLDGVRRVAPNEDEEVTLNRDKCFRRLFPKSEELQKVYKEYGAFACGLEYFGQPHVMAARATEEPLSWWANYGASTPLLQGLAMKLLSQPASSSNCERNWSTYASIQTVKRNRLTSSRSEDLVYVHNNLRLLSRKQNDYIEGPTKYWDIGNFLNPKSYCQLLLYSYTFILCNFLIMFTGGDAFDGDSLLEHAELSLNEPEIEAVTFDLDNL